MNGMTVASVTVRQDAEGRFSLNDLHRAAGGERRHGPSLWLANQQAQALVEEIKSDTGNPVSVGRGGQEQGTYVVKELVYAYAMWISAAFHLQVIRAYDAMVTRPAADPMVVLNDPAAMRGLLLTYTEKVLALEGRVAEQAPKVAALERIADADGSLCLRESAKALQVPERKFIAFLHASGWIFKTHGGRNWLGYAEKTKAGLLTHKVTEVTGSNGEPRIAEQVRVTPLGITRLSLMLSTQAVAA